MFWFGSIATLIACGAIWYAYTQRAKLKDYAAKEAASAEAAVKAKL